MKNIPLQTITVIIRYTFEKNKNTEITQNHFDLESVYTEVDKYLAVVNKRTAKTNLYIFKGQISQFPVELATYEIETTQLVYQ